MRRKDCGYSQLPVLTQVFSSYVSLVKRQGAAVHRVLS